MVVFTVSCCMVIAGHLLTGHTEALLLTDTHHTNDYCEVRTSNSSGTLSLSGYLVLSFLAADIHLKNCGWRRLCCGSSS